MVFLRLGAAIYVLGLMGSIFLVGIGVIVWTNPTIVHGNNVLHADGKIVAIGPNRDFVLETGTKQKMHFQCHSECYASLAHMQRHLREGAHTDIYYRQRQGSQHSLIAIDVD